MKIRNPFKKQQPVITVDPDQQAWEQKMRHLAETLNEEMRAATRRRDQREQTLHVLAIIMFSLLIAGAFVMVLRNTKELLVEL